MGTPWWIGQDRTGGEGEEGVDKLLHFNDKLFLGNQTPLSPRACQPLSFLLGHHIPQSVEYCPGKLCVELYTSRTS